MSMSQAVIPLEEGWKKLREGGVLKIQEILEDLGDGQYSKKITTDEYSSLYTTVYTMCTQKPPNNWSENLYQNYCEAIKDYLSSRILPHIKEKHDESMLKELVRAAPPARRPIPAARFPTPLTSRAAPPPPQVRRWQNHTLMIRFLSHVFKYLDRFYVKRLSLPELKEVGDQNFHEIVFNAVKRDVRAAVLEMVRKEREGEQIDRKLIRQVVEIFVEMGSSRTGLEARMSTALPARRTAHAAPAPLPRLTAPRLTAPLLLFPPSPGVRHRLRGAAAHHHRRLLLARVREVGRGGLVPRLHGEGGGSNPGPTCTSSTSSTSYTTTHPPPTTRR